VNYLFKQATEHADGRYAYLGPLYRQVKQAAWDGLKVAAAGSEPSESELSMKLPNGAKIQLFGADNYQALRGMHLDGIVLDEYGDMNPAAWTEVIRPALSIKRGFAVFIGTPKGRNHFYRLYESGRQDADWFTALYRHADSGVVAESEIALARRQMTEDHFAQEYECSFEAAIQGAYYARQLEATRAAGRIKALAWEPTIPVDTYWDLGFTDATAVIFAQRIGRELHLIDFLENRFQDLAYYAKELQIRPYLYGRHYLPHDAGYHQQAAAGRPIESQLNAMGVKPTTVLAKNAPLDGINEARLLFPRVWFDADKCAPLLDALAAYKAKYDENKQEFSREPDHDWSSHAADAFRYMAVSLKDHRGPLRTGPVEPAQGVAFNPRTYHASQRQTLGVNFRPPR
jgi:hypothetical protein